MSIPFILSDEVSLATAGRWIIPLLAAMAKEPGSRFGALVRRLQISRSVLSATLLILEEQGWMVRHHGHGHPLRPEYMLTPAGRRLARWSAGIVVERNRNLIPDGLGRWSLPVLLALSFSPKRFSSLQRDLAPITPRALSLGLQQLVGWGLVEHLPAARYYQLTERGRAFAAPIQTPA